MQPPFKLPLQANITPEIFEVPEIVDANGAVITSESISLSASEVEYFVAAVNNVYNLRTSLAVQQSILSDLIRANNIDMQQIIILQCGQLQIPVPLYFAMQRADEVLNDTELFK